MIGHGWVLPGPRRFLSRILRDVVEGKCVVVDAPSRIHPELAARIRGYLRDREHRVDSVPSKAAPLQAIVSVCAGLDDCDSVGALVSTIGFSKRTFVACANDVDELNAWLDFMPAFHHGIVKLDQTTRPTIVLVGCCDGRPPSEDVALSNLHWKYVWRDADSMALAESMLAHVVQKPSLFDLVAINTVARLAMWDEELALELGKRPYDTVLDPVAVLKSVGLARKWDEVVTPGVESGTVGYLNGKEVVNSAWIAAVRRQSDERTMEAGELWRRRWHAQAAVLLPWVEERRLELHAQAAGYFPDSATNGDLSDTGPFAFALDRTNAPLSLKRKAHQLRRARNELAHLRLLSPAAIRELNAEFPS